MKQYKRVMGKNDAKARTTTWHWVVRHVSVLSQFLQCSRRSTWTQKTLVSILSALLWGCVALGGSRPLSEHSFHIREMGIAPRSAAED